jgi:hypothetical protein
MKVTLSTAAAATFTLVLLTCTPVRAQDVAGPQAADPESRGITDTIKENAKTVGSDIKKGAQQVADKSRQVGHAVADGTRKAGATIGTESKKAGKAVQQGAQSVGQSVKEGTGKAKAAVSGSKTGEHSPSTSEPSPKS